MNITSTTPQNDATTAELIQRLGMILGGLAALIAARFLRRPSLVQWIVPLWKRLTQAALRVERAVARGTPKRATRPGRTGGEHSRQLPMGRGWLVRELGWEASGFRSQLEHMLAEPGMQALLAAVPGVGRVLRPICRMLGAVIPGPVVATAAAVPTADDELQPARPTQSDAPGPAPCARQPARDLLANRDESDEPSRQFSAA